MGKHITASTFKNNIPEFELVKIKNIYCFEYAGDRQAIIDGIVKRLEAIHEPHDLFKMLKDGLESHGEEVKGKYPILFDTFKEFSLNMLNTSKASYATLQRRVFIYLKTFKCLVDFLDDDIDHLTNKAIVELASLDVPYNALRTIGRYIEYLKKHHVIAITNSLRVQSNKSIKTSKDFYTMEEWGMFVKKAFDLPTNIRNSFKNITYAKCWLYILLNLCITWRKEDILSLPRLDMLLDIEKYDLDWFNNNELTKEEASYIISTLETIMNNNYAGKTKERLHAHIPEAFKIPIAVSIIILENWRRKTNKDNLFGSFGINMPKMLAYHFGDNFKDFGNRKANRTLLSMVDKISNEMDASSYTNYSTYMRSHKVNYYNMSDMTSQYLSSYYNDKELDDIMLQLYSRGPFGGLFNLLLDSFINDRETSFNDLTTQISTLNDKTSIIELNGLADMLLDDKLAKQNVIKELLSTKDKNEIKELVGKLHAGLAYSKQDGIGCVCDSCPYPLKLDCVDCKYAVQTMYAMESICMEFKAMLDTPVSTCERDNIRYSYKLLKLYITLNEAVETLGNDFVAPYIKAVGLPSFEELVKSCQTKYLQFKNNYLP